MAAKSAHPIWTRWPEADSDYYADAISDHAVRFVGEHAKDQFTRGSVAVGFPQVPGSIIPGMPWLRN
jgi:hypothetical protein